MGKYKCPKCGLLKDYFNISILFRNGRLVNLDSKTGEEIKCPNCKIPMVFQTEKGPISVHTNLFNSLSPESKKEVLKKRSQEDAKKKKYIDNYNEQQFYSKKNKI